MAGALLSARREKPRMAFLLVGATLFGMGFAIAAFMPSYWLFGLALVVVGVAAQTFTTTAIGAVQLWTVPAMRGRVMAILLAVAMGGTPLGAPLVGWVADRFGPRWALGVGAASGFAAALVGVGYLVRSGALGTRSDAGRLRFTFGGGVPASDPRTADDTCASP